MTTKNNIPRMLEVVSSSTDAEKLSKIAKRAREAGENELERAASLRLYEASPSQKPGTFEHDVWKSIHALEHALSTERNKTTRLQRTRNSITAKGELETVASLVLKPKPSEGFGMLIDRDMSDLTFEAVTLRHQERFETEVVSAAKTRLTEARHPSK